MCHCRSEYVGRTGASLLTRIGQHVPKKIRSNIALNSSQSTTNDSGPPVRRSAQIKNRAEKSSVSIVGHPILINVMSEPSESSTSAIGEHLIANKLCLSNYNDAKFSVLAHARSDYHLKILEAIFITSRNPVLCKQKKFVLPLKIFNRF